MIRNDMQGCELVVIILSQNDCSPGGSQKQFAEKHVEMESEIHISVLAHRVVSLIDRDVEHPLSYPNPKGPCNDLFQLNCPENLREPSLLVSHCRVSSVATCR